MPHKKLDNQFGGLQDVQFERYQTMGHIFYINLEQILGLEWEKFKGILRSETYHKLDIEMMKVNTVSK